VVKRQRRPERPPGWTAKAPPPKLAVARVKDPLRELWINASNSGEGFDLCIEDVEEECVEITQHPTMKDAKRHAHAAVGDLRWSEPST
jgi:hypothetical protein